MPNKPASALSSLLRFATLWTGGSARRLEQTEAELQELASGVNDAIAEARGATVRLSGQAQQLAAEAQGLQGRIRACIGEDDRGTALALAERLGQIEQERERLLEHLSAAVRIAESLSAFRHGRLEALRREGEQGVRGLRDSEARAWRSRLAEAFERLDIAGLSVTGDELVDSLRPPHEESPGEAEEARAPSEASAARREAEKRVLEIEAAMGRVDAPMTPGRSEGAS